MSIPMTPEQYALSGGVICPVCESTNLSGCGVDIEEGIATQAVMCLDCDADWTDVYHLKGYRSLDTGEDDDGTDSVIMARGLI